MERDPWLVDEPHQANAAPADWGALPALPPSLPPRVPRASPEVSPALDGIFEVDADAEDADLDFKGWREEREATAKVDQIAVGDMGTVMQRLRFIMVCYGDSSSPRSACLLLLLECLEDVQRAIARQIAGHRRRGTSAASASSAAAPPRAPPSILSSSLSHFYPREWRDLHSALEGRKLQALSSESGAGDPNDEAEAAAAASGVGGDRDDREDEAGAKAAELAAADAAAATAGDAAGDAVAAEVAARAEARRALLDERTVGMRTEAYLQFTAARKGATLACKPFIRLAASTVAATATLGVKSTTSLTCRFFAHLCVTRLAAVVEAANRHAHDGELRPRSRPLSFESCVCAHRLTLWRRQLLLLLTRLPVPQVPRRSRGDTEAAGGHHPGRAAAAAPAAAASGQRPGRGLRRVRRLPRPETVWRARAAQDDVRETKGAEEAEGAGSGQGEDVGGQGGGRLGGRIVERGGCDGGG